MATTLYANGSEPGGTASQSAVSWAAVFAGALAAGVLSLLLFMLGIGLGLSSVSVWSGKGADGATIGWGAIAWLIVTQLVSAAAGGYLAGRLRTKWQGVHTDEVYFRDTAHGFLSWALATICMVALAGSVVGSAISGVGKAAASVTSGAVNAAGALTSAAGGAASAAISGVVGAGMGAAGSGDGADSLQYTINSLLRKVSPSDPQKQDAKDTAQDVARAARSAAEDAKEVGLIFTHAVQAGSLTDEDAAYVGQMVSQRSGMGSEEAKQKVKKAFEQVQQQIQKVKQAARDAEEKAKQAAEDARKATAYSLLWMFVVLLIGAFFSSLAATIGGRQRNID